MGAEQLKDSMSPGFTTPVDGSTDRTGGGKEGMERVGAASAEVQLGRGAEEDRYHYFYRSSCEPWSASVGCQISLSNRQHCVSVHTVFDVCFCGFYMKYRM